jgi:hypothetical protein
MICVKNIVALLMITGLVFGCSSKEEGSVNSNSDSEPLTGLTAEAAEKAKAENDAAKAKIEAAAKKAATTAKLAEALKTPTSEYERLESEEQAAYLYYAISKLPTDYDVIASKVSEKYRYSNDGFEKKEILNSLKPAVDEKISAYKAKPIAYVRAKAELGAFDFERKGFVVGAVGAESTYYSFGSYHIQFKNAAQANFIVVNDEVVARELESMRAGYRNSPIANIYFLADDSDLDGRSIKALITKVEIIDRSGRVLASIQPNVN